MTSAVGTAAQGLVRAPDMDLGDQMTQLMVAERAYQANLTAIGMIRDLVAKELELGRS